MNHLRAMVYLECSVKFPLCISKVLSESQVFFSKLGNLCLANLQKHVRSDVVIFKVGVGVGGRSSLVPMQLRLYITLVEDIFNPLHIQSQNLDEIQTAVLPTDRILGLKRVKFLCA